MKQTLEEGIIMGMQGTGSAPELTASACGYQPLCITIPSAGKCMPSINTQKHAQHIPAPCGSYYVAVKLARKDGHAKS